MSSQRVIRAIYHEDDECIAVYHKKYVNDVIGWARFTDYIYSTPRGNWIDIRYSKIDDMEYRTFLETMVTNNVYVARKLAKLASVCDDSWDDRDKIESMHAIRILDPTFTPPYIILKCTWQRNLLDDLIGRVVHEIIGKCRNKKRLDRYYEVMTS